MDILKRIAEIISDNILLPITIQYVSLPLFKYASFISFRILLGASNKHDRSIGQQMITILTIAFWGFD